MTSKHLAKIDSLRIAVVVHVNGEMFALDLTEEAYASDVMRAYRNGRDPANAVSELAHLGYALADPKSPTYCNAIGDS